MPSASRPRPALAINPEIENWPEPEPGRYLIAGEFARGGRGRILKAYDRRLDRDVALKELLIDDGRAKARFVREALVTARLQHPAIIPIFDVGRWSNGKPFFAMKLLPAGRSMARGIEAAKGLEERLALLPALVAVSDAVAYAHQQGVLHRDLKPSNVLLGLFGETMVIDWGLATDIASAEEHRPIDSAYALAALPLTHTGSVMGTPLYMAPEQSKGKRLDERADVYALGAILYHLLAGVPPYAEASPQDILERLEQKPPAPVEETEPRVPKELVAIVCKALSKDPADRYATAKAFADELKRFQTGQLVRAYRYSRGTLLRRWLARHRAPVLVALAFAALFVLAGGMALRRLIHEHSVAETKNSDLIVFQARSLLEKDPTAAVAFLKSYRVLPDRENIVRDIALRAYSAGIARHVFRRDESWASLVAFSPDSRLIATPRHGGKLQVVELESGRVIGELQQGSSLDARVWQVAFSADGTHVLFSDWNGTWLYKWNYRSGEVKRYGGQRPELLTHRFSADRQWMAGRTAQASIWVWNLSTFESRELQGHRGKIADFVFVRRRGELISASTDGTVRVWNLSDGSSRLLEGIVPGLKVLSASETSIAAADAEGTIHLWDALSGRKLASHAQQNPLLDLEFSSDGRRLASAGESGTLRVLDVESGATTSFAGHQGAIKSVTFASENRVATGGLDGTVRIWDLSSGSQRILRGHSAGVLDVVFSKDRQYLASSGNDATARVWRMLGADEEEKTLRGHTDAAMHVLFSPDGGKLATAGRDHVVRVWDRESLAGIALRGHTDLVYYTDFSPDGAALASVGFDGVLRLWDLSQQTSRALRFHQGTIWTVKFSHRGDTVATGGADGLVVLWDFRSGAVKKSHKEPKPIYSLAFSPDDRLLAFAGGAGLGMWDLEADQISPRFRGQEATDVAFSPDGLQVAWVGNAKSLTVADVRSGKINQLPYAHGNLRLVVYSPDGKYVAAGDNVDTVVLWELASNRVTHLRGHTAQIMSLAFSARGSLLASASWDGTVRLWDVATGLPRAIHSERNQLKHVAVSPDGKLVATVGSDASVKLWPVTPAPQLSEAAFYDDFMKWAAAQTSALFEADFATQRR
jgi:WD40 repeat protein/tRNA A-37 threonylcarbamoyl transferase component Bud32